MSNTPEIRFEGFTDLPAGRQALGNWCTYVILCEDGSLYKGKTNNLQRRMHEHVSGKGGAAYTHKHRPIRLVYIKWFNTEAEALKQEKYLKSGSGREWLKANVDLTKGINLKEVIA